MFNSQLFLIILSNDGLQEKIDALDKKYNDIILEFSRIIKTLEEKESIRLIFLESSFSEKTFGDKIDKLIDRIGKNDLLYLKIMGYFDNHYIRKLKNCADRVNIISHKNVKDNSENSTLLRALNRMNEYGAKVGFHPELHARMILTNDEVIIGSGDLQARCLSGNRAEACIWTNNPTILKESLSFFDRIWEDSEIMEARAHGQW